VVVLEPDRSGLVVLCTDGLWNYVDHADALAATLPRGAALMDVARTLVRHARAGGGHDNVTVAVLPFVIGDGEGAVG
jgi:serine/threonine protein phosphatase PrpC